jgi:hypothetical protein
VRLQRAHELIRPLPQRRRPQRRRGRTLDTLKATDNKPLQPARSVAELEHLVTNLVGGTAPASGDAFVAEWPLLVIGARPQLGVTIRRINARLGEDFGVEIVCWQRANVALIDPKAFAVCAGITAAVALTEFAEVPEGSAETAAAEEQAKATKASAKK